MASPDLSKSLSVRLLALATTLALVACGGGDAGSGNTAQAAADDYVAERSEADGIETVRTVSGSRWGGAPRLVEELGIGEELGEDAYLFGSITAAWATDDMIIIVDSQVPAVRAFDHEGNFLFDIGSTGQGPGEYNAPLALAVTDDGRIMVTDLQGARLNIYDAEGNNIEDWSLGSPQSAMGLELTYDGEVFTRMIEMPENMEFGGGPIQIRTGMQAVGPEGLTGEPVFPPDSNYEPPTVDVEMGNNRMQMSILPFTPSFEWTMAPGGEIISGVSNEYSFAIRFPDGRQLNVEKAWNPVDVDPGEKAFRADAAAANVRQMAPEFALPTSDVPDTKAAFTRFRADRSGRVWVVRQGPSRPDADCTEQGGSGGGMTIMMSSSSGGGTNTNIRGPGGGGGDSNFEGECWVNTYVFDVFEVATGEFLGSVPSPELGFSTPLFVDDDVVLAAVTDAMGIQRLKKYRLVVN